MIFSIAWSSPFLCHTDLLLTDSRGNVSQRSTGVALTPHEGVATTAVLLRAYEPAAAYFFVSRPMFGRCSLMNAE
jgi:hypothetical protein